LRRLAGLAVLAVVAIALVLVTAAGADIVNNNESEITVVAGGSSVGVGFFITETGGDCNPADGTPAVLTIEAPSEITASPGQLTFAACDTPQTVAFSAPASTEPGTYEVTVNASDDGGGTWTESPGAVTVTVEAPPPDTTPPTITLPSPVPITAQATSAAGAVVTFSVSAFDNVDGTVPVSCAPASGSMFPVGDTSVGCTASDDAGNSARNTFTVSVQDMQPPTVTPPAPINVPPTSSAGATVEATGPKGGSVTPPAEDPPPGNVTKLRAKPGNRVVRVLWTAPRDADVARYAAFRSERSGPQVRVYSGAATSFTDRGLVNGVQYRYVVVAYDRPGNRSAGVAVLATPRLPMLLAPQDGARFARSRTFSWRRIPRASYYNFQLFRATDTADGTERFVKVLSVWPRANVFKLRSSWRFAGRKYRLVPGTYRWYVWPGFGARADVRYGDPLGDRTFVVVRRR
jgi:HYR domain